MAASTHRMVPIYGLLTALAIKLWYERAATALG